MSLSTIALAQDKAEQVKAVFLFKFVDYITWPSQHGFKSGDQFNLCVKGEHLFGKTLDIIAAGQNRYLYKISYLDDDEPLSNCHILYTKHPETLPDDIKGVFLVSDTKGFARQGGMMELSEDNGKISLITNLKTSKKAGFEISSRLLKIAEVIR